MTAPVPAGPTDAHAELREEIARSFAPKHWPVLLERHRDRLRARADAVLALDAVRDALVAQETVRRVRLYVDHPGLPDPTCRKLIRRALAGDS